MTNDFEIRPLDAANTAGAAQLHFDLFGTSETDGYSVAKLGTEFLDSIFYSLNLDNPHFFCDVACYRGQVIGFSVYTPQRQQVFRTMVRRHGIAMAWRCAVLIAKRPSMLASLLHNARYLGGESVPVAESAAWWLVAGVRPEYRTREFEAEVGGPVAARFCDRVEETIQARGCQAWYVVVRPDNVPVHRFLERLGARLMGTAQAQGLEMQYYLKTLVPDGTDAGQP
ncbi:MAG: hypothetical protein ABR543_11545 [Gemmatimonadaceae bacterium]